MSKEAAPKPEKPEKKAGRPPKLDVERVERLCQYLRAGNYIKTACAGAGISQSLYHNWHSTGCDDREAGRKTKFVEFLERIEEASAEAEIMLVAEVRKAGGKGALEVLKRRFRDRWGDKALMEHSGPDGTPIPTSSAPINLVITMAPTPGGQAPWTFQEEQDPEPENGNDPWESESLSWPGQDPPTDQAFEPRPPGPPVVPQLNPGLARRTDGKPPQPIPAPPAFPPAPAPTPGMPPSTGGRSRDPDEPFE